MTREAVADILVDVPVEVVYRAWSDFEHYPRFMPHVKHVRRTDANGRRLRWESKAKGIPRAWDAEVTDLTINQRVAWRSLSGRANDGAVLLEPQGQRTHVTLRWTYEPVAEGDGHPASIVADDMTQAVHEDLVNFKRLVETGQPPRAPCVSPWLGASIVLAAALAAVGVRAWYARGRRQAWAMSWPRNRLARYRRPRQSGGVRSLTRTATSLRRALAR